MLSKVRETFWGITCFLCCFSRHFWRNLFLSSMCFCFFFTGGGKQSSLNRWKMYGECCCTDGESQRSLFVCPIFPWRRISPGQENRPSLPGSSAEDLLFYKMSGTGSLYNKTYGFYDIKNIIVVNEFPSLKNVTMDFIRQKKTFFPCFNII